MRLFILTLCIGLCLRLSAQEKLSNAFSFANGIYESHESFRENRPDIQWSEVKSDLIVMEAIHRAKLGNLLRAEDSSAVDLSKAWGFSINGIPYVRVGNMDDNGFHEFAGLQVRGRICYYEYETTEHFPVEISAYNPLTGKPFRTKTVMREKRVANPVMLDFKTGGQAPLSAEKVEEWIASDERLLTTFRETEQKKREEKLLKFVRIFNDRNGVDVGE